MTTENNIQPVLQRFKLLYTTKKRLNEGTPKFGFNGLGEVVFRRTYSRDNESWNDVVKRVIEGVMSIRKEHFVRNSLEWNDDHWQEFAKEMAMSLFNMEWMPPGRGLWMMGTDFMYARGSTSLNNCSAVDTKDDLVHAAEWTMDCLMNGVGVGFSTNWRGEATKPNKEDTITFTIPDSREGWLESLTKLLCSYINSKKYGKNKYPILDYSQIRPSGSPIKGFGGVSSGPEPLKKLHQRVESYLDAFCDQKLEARVKTWKEITDEATGKSEWKEVEVDICKPYDHTRLIADIFNAIGACVVAGNVRRSAEIALGNVNDQTFINLKNYVENPERGEIGWMSNNSVVLNSDHDYEDFSYIPDMARRIIDNGEPGMINLYNIQKFGRYGKEMEDKANLVNPCVTADTWIMTSLGSFQVKDLLGKQFAAVVDGKVHNCNTGFFPTGTKPVYQLTTYEGFTVKTTGDHKFMTSTGEWVELEKFVEGDNIKIHDHSSLSVQVDNLSIDFMNGWLMGNLYGDGTFQYNADKPSTAYLCYWGNNKAMMADVAISRLDALSYKRKSEFITGTEYNDKITIANNDLYQRATTYIQRGKVLTDHVESASLNFQAGFLRGWFDADGSVQGTKEKGYSIRLACSNLDSLYRAQRMALRLGIYGKIYQNRREEHDKMLPDGHGSYKSYHCQAQHEFIISRAGLKTFQDKINFDDPEKQSKLQEILCQYKRPLYGVKFNATVKSITLIGEESVYDATVEDVHAFDANGFYVHNCGEIPLESFELCNLAEVFPPRCKNGERYFQALKFATFYASTVSLLPTHRSETNAVIAKNRRIGVSISGVAQWASGEVDPEWGGMNYTKMTKFLREGYKVVRAENKKLAQLAGVPESIRVTTVKPSGSISLLAGVTAGVHYPVSRYAIRRMRIGADSPLVKVLQDAGVPNEPDSYSDNTLVFSFAIDHGNVRPCEEVSPWEQFSLVATMQRCYADNCVSATIYFDKEKDAADVEKMLAMYIPILKSVSMLPHAGHGYKQAPYEPITQEQFEKLKDEYNLPDFSTLSGMVPVGSKFCSGDTCEA